jgi:hypothetical protein
MRSHRQFFTFCALLASATRLTAAEMSPANSIVRLSAVTAKVIGDSTKMEQTGDYNAGC